MPHDHYASFRVREDLYLKAHAYLGDLEGRLGDDVEPYSISYAGHYFILEPLIRDAFEADTGHPMTPEEHELTDRYFMGIASPGHYNQSLDQYTDGIYDVEPDSADAIRDIVFAFTTAWSHRYGGFSHARTRNGSVIGLGQE